MSWFDGTFEWTEDELKKEFSIEITRDLRCNEDRTKMALVNRLKEGTALYDLSDPHTERGRNADYVFYDVFQDDEAVVAEDFIREFIKNGHADEPESIGLFRQDPEKMYLYSFGHISLSRIGDQSGLRTFLPEDIQEKTDVFVLPMKRYMYECPICHYRNLTYRYQNIICLECGWEDDEDREDAYSGPNHCTPREYREQYLKLKKENPGYSWWTEVRKRD